MAKNPKIGPLRFRIELFILNTTVGDGGVTTKNLVSQGTRFANIEALSGNEQLNSLQLNNPVSHRITIRQESGSSFLDVKQITQGDRTFRVEAARSPDQRGRFVQYLTEEGGETYDITG